MPARQVPGTFERLQAKHESVHTEEIGHDLMGRYESVTFGEVVVADELLLGVRRVEIQNLLQDYGDRILNQKIEP
jgi:hypothetical protein